MTKRIPQTKPLRNSYARKYLIMKILPYVIASVIFIGTLSSCTSASKKIELKNTDTLASLHNGQVKIAYTDEGMSDTTLLFVHGWAINKGYWTDQTAYFSKRYRVVAIDLPGFGASGTNRDKWGTVEYAGDIDSVIKQLDLKKVVLIGHSMSGDIVLQAAIDNPEKVIGVVGIDNFKGVGEPVTPQAKKGWEDALAMMRKDFKKVTTDWLNKQLVSKTTSADIKKRILNDVEHTDRKIAIASLEQGNDFDELAKLKQSKQKLYLISSDVTPTNTQYLDAERLPYQVFYTKGTGHYAMIENPKEFNEYLDKVLLDISKAK
jgi:pimeloyl-ACP methyl ester carboxylesterase